MDISETFSLQENADGYYLRLMLWEDFVTLKPISEAFEYSLN